MLGGFGLRGLSHLLRDRLGTWRNVDPLLRGGHMTGGESPHEEWREGEEPGSLAWVRGMDYLSHWTDADDAVTDFYAALREAGVSADGIRATASTDESGAGVVRGVSSPESLREITGLIRRGAGLPDLFDDGLGDGLAMP